MKKNFYYTFPAIKGKQAQRDYFVIMCPLGVLSKLFIFNEEELPAEYRAQRTLNRSRIPEIANYVISNPKDYVFSSLTSSVDGNFEFTPFPDDKTKEIGILKISMDSKLLINDGQHRRAAIEEALKAAPELGDETISVVLFIDENLKRSQQIFADLNKHAINVSKSLGVLYDSRDPIALITKHLIESNALLKNYTDMENTSLPKFSPKLFILSSVNETNKKLLSKLNANDENNKNFVYDFWNFLCENLKDWQFVFNKEISPHIFRNTYVSSNGVVLEALGIVGNYLLKNNIIDWENYLIKLNDIDWNRSNLKNWEDRVIGKSGRIIKSSRGVRLTSNLIKTQIGLPLSKDEEKLELEFK
ncbi:DNA sulfur modification protein DndB [Clostridium sp. A1-XYC3]|uniref:DNA sulfur modification protein DndB n=1 Tax=Clostridium tanneri TaxID=3037988 RepID=A0ABU4JTI5_9CLOT|nr:DNA sulfur modification protein DndB [Clostridium sp. A1-XYC3]MDW8801467.1 DNA sulfur modification protein DndB [Clostridium sp. A1-XYC3]